MKTNEFINKLEGLGYTVEYNNAGNRLVVTGENMILARIHTKHINQIDTIAHTTDLYANIPTILLDIVVEYGSTPIDERVDEQLYRVILPIDNDFWDYKYLDKYGNIENTDYIFFIDQLTEKQINNVDKRFMIFAEKVAD